MPHLQGPKEGASKDGEEKLLSTASAGDESGSGAHEGGDKLLSLVVTATKHAPAGQAANPQVEVRKEVVPPAAAGHPERPQVTPSPYGVAPHRGFEQPPYYGYESHPPSWMPANAMYDRRAAGGYGQGARRLFPSPIRYNRTKSDDEETDESKRSGDRSPPRSSDYPFRGPPPPLVGRPPFYGPPGSQAYPGYYHYPYGYDDQYPHPQGDSAPPSPIKKRSGQPVESSPKRCKPTKQESPKQEKQSNDKGVDDPQSPASTEGGMVESKQRVISPSSSIEANVTGKSQDDESPTGTSDRGIKTEPASNADAPATQEMSGPARFPPHHPAGRYGAPPGPYQPPYYPPGRGMYAYPPPPHFSEGPPPHGTGWGVPPHGATPPQYPPSYPTPYGRPPMPPQRYPAPGMHSESLGRKPSDPKPTSALSSKSGSPQRPGASKIKSVAEWQRATLATGKAPSANRCMPLKAPIPSKYWGEAEKTKDCAISDFHQLVNFPDYLNKVKPNGSETPGASSSGKRPCVMCGKHRVCSASTANLGGNVMRRPKKSGEEEDDDDVDSHIIPRQNKGLCTACDVTVWVFVESGLEIKWCKGCKNFRPWAAFGDKGLATKCVRCRDRQREKYALQKDELRLRRLRQNSTKDDKRDECHHEIAAAKGLRDLMAASATI